MPLNNPSPQFGLLTAYDLRDYSGLEIFSRSGGSAVSMPTFTAGQGVYEDALFLINGRMIADDLSNAFFKAKNCVFNFSSLFALFFLETSIELILFRILRNSFSN